MKKRGASSMDHPSDQRSDIAVSPTGYALVHNWPDRKKFQVITAYGEQVGKVSKLVFNAYPNAEGTSETSFIRHDYRAFRSGELAPPTPGMTSNWLVVGLALAPETFKKVDEQRQLKKVPQHRRYRAVGMEEPDEQDKIVLGKDQRVMLVVMSFVANQDSRHLGGLLEEVDGIRSPYQVSQEQVFYFDEFRDSTKDASKRGPGWCGNAFEAIQEMKEDDMPLSKRRKQAAVETIEADEEPVVQVKQELQDKVEAARKESVQEKDYLPDVPMSQAMTRFVRHQEVFERAEAQQLHEELRELWSDIRDLSAPHLLNLHDGLKQKGCDIEPRLVYNFLVASTQLWTENDWRITPVDLVEQSWQRAVQFYYPGKNVRTIRGGLP